MIAAGSQLQPMSPMFTVTRVKQDFSQQLIYPETSKIAATNG